MLKIRLHGTCEEVGKFKTYLETLSPRVKVLCASDNYADRGKSVYVRSYLDIELKPQYKAKEGIDIRQLVRDKYTASYESFLLWSLNWSDIGYVIVYLKGYALRNPTQQLQVQEIIDFIKESCENE